MSRTARLRSVLFDLDGTLLDTAPDFATVMNLLLAENDCAPMAYDLVRRTVSNGARALVRQAFGIAEDHPRFEALRLRLLELYDGHLLVDTVPFPGIVELLGELGLRGISWGVVTNKPSYLAAPLMERVALRPAPGVLVCPDHVTRTKPDPEPLLLACSRLGCAVEESVYVGDHRRDIEAGRQAGMATIAATYGYLDQGELASDWNADFYADTVAGIQDVLARHFYRH
ncbi:MAG: HAD-IA family hydrolase [Gammaproteobacteria bacterium]|nr:HAD-IA family hydrolase [Gammaproteobacteria bacterium]